MCSSGPRLQELPVKQSPVRRDTRPPTNAEVLAADCDILISVPLWKTSSARTMPCARSPLRV